MYKNKENDFTGLTEEEVKRSREEHGSNKLPDPELTKWWEFALDALKEPITVILIVITIVTLILSILGVEHISGPILTLIVIGLVTGIAVKTNTAIQKSTENLRRKTATRYCEVIRDGEVKTINADDLVVGDITLVTLGQEIHADGYLIDGKISVNNAVVNGEAEECKKTVIPGYVYEKDESTDAYKNQNHLFAGTVVVAGEGLEKVTVVGKDTVNGETLINMQTLEAPKTALDIALGKLANFINKWGTIAAIIAFVTMTVSGIMQIGLAQYFSGNVLEVINRIAANVSNASTIIVAAVPEGLPLIVKLVTKQNVSTMEKFNILAKNPNKIPELAYVNLICTDKTGTLTTGVMSPEVIVDGEGNEVGDNSDLAKTLHESIVLNNSSFYNEEHKIVGNNFIDRAILSLVVPKESEMINEKCSVERKQAFSSELKYSVAYCSNGYSYYKGAPEIIIDNCTKYNSGCGLTPIIPINATSCSAMFEKCEDILDLSQFNTHNIITMSDMFTYYRGTELDVSMLDTGNVKSFTSMFFCCNKLKELNLLGLNTAKAVDMSCMFWNCSSLVELDLSSFSTELVQGMHHMFWNCRNLRTVDLSSFSTVNVKDMEGMFKDCGKLYKLDLSSFSTENLDKASQMFWGCKELLEIKTAGKARFGINAPKHNDIYKMCDLLNPALEELSALAPIQDEKGNLTFTLCDIFSKRELAEARFNALFNKVYVVNVLSEESRKKCLKELEADTGKEFAWFKESYGKEHWVLYDTDVFEVRGIDEYLHIKKFWCAPHIPVNATTCHLMFKGCGNIDFSNFYTNNVVDMSYMFYNADNTVKLDLSGFDTSKVETMEAMFSNMYALKYLDVSSFSTERLTNMDAMFDNCVNLVNLDLTSFDTGSVLYMLNTFCGCEQLEEILVSDKWSVCGELRMVIALSMVQKNFLITTMLPQEQTKVTIAVMVVI